MAKLSISVEKALARTPKRLGALLAPGVEYTGTVYRKLPYCDGSGKPRGNRYVGVSGTLPTLAAALGKPELLRFLLDLGHDVNSASQSAIEALIEDNSLHDFLQSMPKPRPGAFYANMCSAVATGTLKSLRDSVFPFPEHLLTGSTPLAAAVLCGSVDCVRVLLECPGVWTLECPSVSLALSIGWRSADPAYQEACRLVRMLPGGSQRPLALWAIAGECTGEQLRAELAAAPYDTAAVREAVSELLARHVEPFCPPQLAEKLNVFAEYAPDALATPPIRGRLASLFLTAPTCQWIRGLVERYCRGCTVDLSYMPAILHAIPIKQLASGLDALCALGEPVLSSDAVLVTFGDATDGVKRLRLLLERVRFLPSSFSTGFSKLTCDVLASGSLPLLDLALKKGAIPAREPLDMMLPLIKGTPALRARLLTAKRPEVPLSPPDWSHYPHHSFPESSREESLAPDASPEACRRALLAASPFCGVAQEQPRLELPFGETTVSAPALIFAIQGKTEALREFFLARPESYGMDHIVPSVRGNAQVSDGWMMVTPLCAAALAGQAETAEMLLSLGYDANERDVGSPSSLRLTLRPDAWNAHGGKMYRDIPLSPLLCAVLSGSKETAALLRAHGAAWDMETESAREAMELLGRS